MAARPATLPTMAAPNQNGESGMQEITRYDHGIMAVDSGFLRPHFDAIHLIREGDRLALVDTGTTHSVPRVLAALEQEGATPEQVDYVLLTHVHLDHAGGAGQFMQKFPNARLVVHPRGARHMIDPGKLWNATVAVYGQQVAEASYGEIVPIAAERTGVNVDDRALGDLHHHHSDMSAEPHTAETQKETQGARRGVLCVGCAREHAIVENAPRKKRREA